MTKEITSVSVWGYLREYTEIVERNRADESRVLEEIVFALQQSGLKVDLDLYRVQVEDRLTQELVESMDNETKALRRCTKIQYENIELYKRVQSLERELESLKERQYFKEKAINAIAFSLLDKYDNLVTNKMIAELMEENHGNL